MREFKKVTKGTALKPLDKLMFELSDEISDCLIKSLEDAEDIDIASNKVVEMHSNIFSNFLIKSLLHFKKMGCDLEDVSINFDKLKEAFEQRWKTVDEVTN